MRFAERFYALLDDKSQERGWQVSFSERAGIKQDALSKILSRTTKNPGLDSVSLIVDALDATLILPGETPNGRACTECKHLRDKIRQLEAERDTLKKIILESMQGNSGASNAPCKKDAPKSLPSKDLTNLAS